MENYLEPEEQKNIEIEYEYCFEDEEGNEICTGCKTEIDKYGHCDCE